MWANGATAVLSNPAPFDVAREGRGLLLRRGSEFPPANPTAGVPAGRVAGGHAPFFAVSMWCLLGIAAGLAFAVIDVWGVALVVVVVAALGFVVLAAALLACPPLLVRLLLKMAR